MSAVEVVVAVAACVCRVNIVKLWLNDSCIEETVFSVLVWYYIVSIPKGKVDSHSA